MKEIRPEELNINPFTLLGKDWLVLTAGNEHDGCNSMTVSWGHLGCLWSTNRPTAVVYVRPSRNTKKFIDKEELFTLSLIKDRKALGYLGSHSGAKEDKYAGSGLKPVFLSGTAAIDDASLIIVCRKLYCSQFEEKNFIDKSIVTNDYPDGSFHYVYVGEIVKILTD